MFPPVTIAVIVGCFYLSIRVSLRGAFLTGIVLGVLLTVIELLSPADPSQNVLLSGLSRLLGSVPACLLLNRFDGILGFLVILPIAIILLLAGGPIECFQTFYR